MTDEEIMADIDRKIETIFLKQKVIIYKYIKHIYNVLYFFKNFTILVKYNI